MHVVTAVLVVVALLGGTGVGVAVVAFRSGSRLGVYQSWYSRKLKRRTLYGQLFEQ